MQSKATICALLILCLLFAAMLTWQRGEVERLRDAASKYPRAVASVRCPVGENGERAAEASIRIEGNTFYSGSSGKYVIHIAENSSVIKNNRIVE